MLRIIPQPATTSATTSTVAMTDVFIEALP
jgi:hypothetical protein